MTVTLRIMLVCHAEQRPEAAPRHAHPDPTTVLTAAPLVRFAQTVLCPKAIVWPPKARASSAAAQQSGPQHPKQPRGRGSGARPCPRSPSPTGPAPPGDSIILEEEIDPNYVPSQDEIDEYAKWLGMDLVQIRTSSGSRGKASKAPLPEHWKPCKTTDTDEIYYFNFSSGESTWDHPCDEYYRTLYEVRVDGVKRARRTRKRRSWRWT